MSLSASKPPARSIKSAPLGARPAHWWFQGYPGGPRGTPCWGTLNSNGGGTSPPLRGAPGASFTASSCSRNPKPKPNSGGQIPSSHQWNLGEGSGRARPRRAGGLLPRGSGVAPWQEACDRPGRGAVAPSAPAFVTAPWGGPETPQREFLKCFPALPGLSAALSHVQVGSRTDTELGQKGPSRARRGARGLAVRAERGSP